MPSSDLLTRQRATQATLDKYRDRTWSWAEATTCVHMTRFHLRKLGHKPEPLPRVRSLIGAKRALASRGWAGVADMLDDQPGLERIAPAQMLLGDLAAVPGTEGLGAIAICAGPQKLLGWHEEGDGMVVLAVPIENIAGAWRV